VDYEHELAVLTEAFNAKVTPAIAAEIMRRPETALHYPDVVGLLSIKHVNTSKYHCRKVIYPQI
jgi:hypothetical protein